MQVKKRIWRCTVILSVTVSFLYTFSGYLGVCRVNAETDMQEETVEKEEKIQEEREIQKEEKEEEDKIEEEAMEDREKKEDEALEKEGEREENTQKESTQKEIVQKENTQEETVQKEKIQEETEKDREWEEEVFTKSIERQAFYDISAQEPESGQSNTFSYSGSIQTWTVPVSGYYRITAAGGSGGRGWNSTNPYTSESGSAYSNSGSNGYTVSAIFRLSQGTDLHMTIGGAGVSGSSNNIERERDEQHYGGTGATYGYVYGSNGSGSYYYCADSDHRGGACGGAGGGSTGVCIVDGEGKEICILQAAGGNGGSSYGHSCHGWHTGSPGKGGGSNGCYSVDGYAEEKEGSYTYNCENSGSGYVVVEVLQICPDVELEAPSGWTKDKVVITVTVRSEGCGLPESFISWEQDEKGNDKWTDALTFAVSQNGSYTCKIRDTEGNVGIREITIACIDKMEPDTRLKANTTDWTASDIVLTAEGEDAAQTDIYGKSGLADRAYLWEGGEGTAEWTDEKTRMVSQNGLYKCRVRDNAGNERVMEYEVKNIDRTAPKVSCRHEDKWYKGGTQLIWEAEDLQPDGSAGSGLHEKAFSFDGILYSSNNRESIPSPGIYRIWVRDRLENTEKYEFQISYDEPPKKHRTEEGENETLKEIPQIIEPETDDDSENRKSREVSLDSGDKIENASKERIRGEETETAQEITAKEDLQEAADKKFHIETPEKKAEPETGKSTKQGGEIEKKKEKTDWKKAALYSVWCVAILCGLVWFLFALLLEHVTVYRKNEKGKYRLAGTCMIIRKKDYKQINLTTVLERGEECGIKVRFSRVFVFFHRKEKVLLRTYHGVQLKNVLREIELFA